MKGYLTILFVLFVNSLKAQTAKGKTLIEVGFSPTITESSLRANSTCFALLHSEDKTFYTFGVSGGFFVCNKLALLTGLGFTNLDQFKYISFLFGSRYYLLKKIPLQIDFSGSIDINSDSVLDAKSTPTPLYFGMQSGYAIVLRENIMVEPTIRYNVSMNAEFADGRLQSTFFNQNILELRFNFVFLL